MFCPKSVAECERKYQFCSILRVLPIIRIQYFDNCIIKEINSMTQELSRWNPGLRFYILISRFVSNKFSLIFYFNIRQIFNSKISITIILQSFQSLFFKFKSSEITNSYIRNILIDKSLIERKRLIQSSLLIKKFFELISCSLTFIVKIQKRLYIHYEIIEIRSLSISQWFRVKSLKFDLE